MAVLVEISQARGNDVIDQSHLDRATYRHDPEHSGHGFIHVFHFKPNLMWRPH